MLQFGRKRLQNPSNRTAIGFSVSGCDVTIKPVNRQNATGLAIRTIDVEVDFESRFVVFGVGTDDRSFTRKRPFSGYALSSTLIVQLFDIVGEFASEVGFADASVLPLSKVCSNFPAAFSFFRHGGFYQGGEV